MNIKNIGRSISKNEMRKISGGNNIQLVGEEGDGGDSCPAGQFKCTCNGQDFGCVSSISACWNKC